MMTVPERARFLDEVMEELAHLDECREELERATDKAEELECARYLGQSEQRLMGLQFHYNHDAYERVQAERKKSKKKSPAKQPKK